MKKPRKETTGAIKKVVLRDCKEILSVPEREPWQKSSYFGYKKTPVGEFLSADIRLELELALSRLPQEDYALVVGEMKERIEATRLSLEEQYVPLENLISEKEIEIEKLIEAVYQRVFVKSEIAQIREKMERAKELLGELAYADSRRELLAALAEAEALSSTASQKSEKRGQAHEAWREVEDGLYDLTKGHYGFRDATSEERERARNIQARIKEALGDHQFDQVIREVSDLKLWMKKISAAAEERAAQRRKSYPDGIWDTACQGSSDPDEIAQKGVELAQSASEFLGAEVALYFLRSFHYGNLGKDRKRSEFFQLAPEVEASEVGEWLNYSIHRADDVDATFGVAVLFLESQGIEPGRLASQLAKLMLEKQKHQGRLEGIEKEVESGEVALGTFTKGAHSKTGEEQWETEIRRDGETIKCVVDRFSKMEIAPKKEYYFRLGKVLVDNPARRFKIMIVSPIAEKDRDFDAEISALKAEAEEKKENEKEEEETKQETIESLASQLAAAWGAKIK